MNQKNMTDKMQKLVSLCKRRGFIFPGSEIYGGLANSWDYGPLGVTLKNNIKQGWWKRFVQQRLDMVGIDAALIMNPKVWEASGHLAEFSDPLVECKKCHSRYRADQIDLKAACSHCGSKDAFTDPVQFNMMLKTFLGPVDGWSEWSNLIHKLIDLKNSGKISADSLQDLVDFGTTIFHKTGENTVYFRPETAQAMFVDFKQVLETSRKRLPFGIAQIGKAFRNEITPGNFIFRTREFEQMEIEYFVRESEWETHFEHWLQQMRLWLADLGVKKEHIHEVEIPDGERAHYSKRTVDFEYEYPFGQKELYGLAYRGDFDLQNHAKASGQDMNYTNPEDPKDKFVPHVIEPTWGVDRSVLVALLEAYHEEAAPTADEGETEARVVLKFPAWLAPIKVAILPLSKKAELSEVARPLYEKIARLFPCDYDETQSIGKRYRRQDEIGTPYCVTVDFETLNDQAVTVRERDSMSQERIAITELESYLKEKLSL